MFAEGKIRTYNDERGFGFIEIEGEKKDLFFHIKDMPNKNIQPKVGERLKFRIVDDQGKLKADNIARLDVVVEKIEVKKLIQRPNQRSYRKTQPAASNLFSHWIMLIGFIIVAVLGYIIYGKYERAQLAQQTALPVVQAPIVNSNPNGYRCDGRVHCSQMNSREEARWFVRNCPSTKMDGNNDGEPCESDTRW